MAETPNRQARTKNREQATREAEVSTKLWKPASRLPEPEPQEGVQFRWVRKAMLGNEDPTNFSRKVREGWETCRLEDHPEMELLVDKDALSSGLVEIGGLILCRMPVEIIEQRTQYFTNRTNMQMQSVDNNLMKENDSRMPLFNEKTSKVSFGKGE